MKTEIRILSVVSPVFIFLLIFSVSSLVANASSEPEHDLKNVVLGLARFHQKIQLLQKEDGIQPEAAAALNQLSSSTSAVWVDSIVLPIRANEERLANYGIIPKGSPPFESSFRIDKNSKWKVMVNDLQKLDKTRWSNFSRSIRDELLAIKQIQDLLSHSEATRSLPQSEINRAWTFAHGSRLINLRQLDLDVRLAIDCIDFYREKFGAYGLIPRRTNQEVFVWDTGALMERYGTEKLSKISSSQRLNLTSRLDDLKAHVGMSDPPA